MATSIRDLQSISDYAKQAAPYLASEASVRYIMRLHGRRLQAAGAVVKLGTRVWIVPSVMDVKIVEIATEAARGPADGASVGG